MNEEDGYDVTGRKDTAEVSGNGNTVSVRVPEADDGAELEISDDVSELTDETNPEVEEVPEVRDREATDSVELPREDDAGGPYVAVITEPDPEVTLVDDAVVGAIVLGEDPDVVVAGPTGEVSDDNGGTLHVGT